MTPTPRVVDLSHWQYDALNGNFDWDAVRKDGIWGVIYKATEGSTYVDDTYVAARKQILDAGLLFGAYHFFRPGNVEDQVNNFIYNASPTEDMLLCLDHEDEGCSVDDVVEFMKLVEQRTGQRPVLYSGHLIKEQLGSKTNEYLAGARLWLCQYGSNPEWPPNWDTMWLWQYTDGAAGPSPHSIDGIGNCDINSYGGTQEELERSWATGMKPELVVGMEGAEVLWTQASLNLLGAKPPLDVDGIMGPMTRQAIQAFQADCNLVTTGVADEETVDRMLEGLGEWNEKRRLLHT